MRRGLVVLAFTLALGIAVTSATAGGSAKQVMRVANHRVTNSTSTNWSGYAVTGSKYTSVSASWTQPSASCSGTAYSSFWVGLDGDTSNSVEQTGTDADCSGSTPQYYAWYEMYPKYPVNLKGTVRPGDHLSASVTTDGKGNFVLTISDSTQGWTNTTNARLKNAALASAEVIAEAPSSRSGVLPLANFGTVSFTSAMANGVAMNTLSGLDPITMQSGSTVKAQPGNMSNGSFAVAWKHS